MEIYILVLVLIAGLFQFLGVNLIKTAKGDKIRSACGISSVIVACILYVSGIATIILVNL